MGKASALKANSYHASYLHEYDDGFRFMSDVKVIYAKRRWADKALEMNHVPEKERYQWTRFDIPGTSIVIFHRHPAYWEYTEFSLKYIGAQRAYQRELDAFLEEPAEKAPKASRKRKGA